MEETHEEGVQPHNQEPGSAGAGPPHTEVTGMAAELSASPRGVQGALQAAAGGGGTPSIHAHVSG